MARYDMVWYGMLRYITEWYCMVCCGHGMVWYCMVRCDVMWNAMVLQSSLYSLHWYHQGLFVYRPVVVVGNVIHPSCQTEKHHSGAVCFRDRFTKVILKREQQHFEANKTFE